MSCARKGETESGRARAPRGGRRLLQGVKPPESPGRTVQAEGQPAQRSGSCPSPTACGELGEQAGRGLTRRLTGSRGQTLPAAKAAVALGTMGHRWRVFRKCLVAELKLSWWRPATRLPQLSLHRMERGPIQWTSVKPENPPSSVFPTAFC